MAIPYYPNPNWWTMHSVFVHSLLTIVAVVVAFYLGHKEAKRKGLNLDMFYNSALWMGAGALLGGRIAFLIFGSNYSNFNPANIVNFFSYHMGFHSVGVILGGGLGLLGYSLYKRRVIEKEHGRASIFFAKLGDIWVVGAAIGIFFYRIGCFIAENSIMGTETGLPWAVLHNGVARHPVTLYYSFFGLVLFVFLINIRKFRLAEKLAGFVSVSFVTFYAVGRFSIDLLRVYEERYYGLAVSQIILIIVLGLVLLRLVWIKNRILKTIKHKS